MNPLRMPRWSPYVVGAAIGVLSWFTFLFMEKALGTSTSFVGAAAACLSCVTPEAVTENAYFRKEYLGSSGAWKPVVDWQLLLDVFLIVGAFLAARLAGVWKAESVPALWASRFGTAPWKRHLAAFAGGIVLMFGARMAGGCTSGHGISGGLQLAASSWTFFGSMFVAGLVAARVLFGSASPRV
jgi:uncharacterized membrane protein YedE/YeeE